MDREQRFSLVVLTQICAIIPPLFQGYIIEHVTLVAYSILTGLVIFLISASRIQKRVAKGIYILLFLLSVGDLALAFDHQTALLFTGDRPFQHLFQTFRQVIINILFLWIIWELDT